MSPTATDLFCGAGGSSLGFELAGGTLRLGLNHWQRAIETHATNFQHADHDCEDVASLTTAQIRRYPDSDLLLASPECTNHSLAKGARRRKPQASSLFEDGPAGDDEQERSRATMWDVVRFLEQKQLKGKPYKAGVVENVVDAYKWGVNDDGGLFASWRSSLGALGYEHEIVWLNSMFCPPTPQSRDRMYVVFWLRGMRRPDLRFEPPSWCPACASIILGRQTWKRPDRPAWGRYGPQYFYSCPRCAKGVLPGAAPAATAIDWALAAERIGDRERPLAEATRERIRRGLERLAREPFAIRLLHGGLPKPLTLPLVSLTTRHDMAMVMPVAGNTFERTPGNRARDARLVPLDTVHGTHDRALVVPPMGNVDPRNADTDPMPTQTTTTRAAIVQLQRNGSASAVEAPVHTVRAGGKHHGLVMANTENHVPKNADVAPAPTLRTEGGLALAFANRAHNVPRPAEELPTHPVLTGEHLAVVMRNNNSRGDRGAMCSPVREPIRALTTAGHQSLLVPYDRTGEARDPDCEPVQTLTTRDRAALVTTEEEIDDCRFRMFALHEIAAAMVMVDHVDGSEYVVTGNKRERMAQYGNAVTPPAMTQLVSRLLPILDEATA
jgi:DNA (cytosine-5)-methyltransferase 1